jgi:hypothetical protein
MTISLVIIPKYPTSYGASKNPPAYNPPAPCNPNAWRGVFVRRNPII